jgi:hypothetical protein
MEAYPKPRHQYIYTPRYGQRGVLTYAGQTPNGAAPAGVIPNGGVGVGYGYGAGVGVGMNMGVAEGYYPAVYTPRPYYPPSYASYGPNYYGSGAYYPSSLYSGFYNSATYGSMYPLANFYHPYQRHHQYYTTTPGYGYGYGQQAYVYPPGPHATTTTTTTYNVTNGPRQHLRDDYQLENRRVATERGAYAPRPIKPADARSDDPFWCRERNGEWHLRTYYQIENECYPGRWRMDPEIGYLVFNRD